MGTDDITSRRAEIASKLADVRALMQTRNLDVIYLTTEANTAWITAGAATAIDESQDAAAFTIAITPERAAVLTDTIETPRLRDEEQLEALGFEMVTEPWYRRGPAAQALASGHRVAWDVLGQGGQGGQGSEDVRADLRALRLTLRAGEIERMREVCSLGAAALDVAIRAVRPGMTENEAAGLFSTAARALGCSPIVVLVGSDDRFYNYRHPVSTAKPIEQYLMLVACVRRYGLVAALTRCVYFGTLPDALRETALAVARVDARVILGTQPGRTLADMFALVRQAYADEGHPEAIEEHHQGGSIGYLSREALARPDDHEPIATNQAFAWNPSIRGAKSEDTILLNPDGPEVLTTVTGWPLWTVNVAGQEFARPAILEVE